MSLPAPCLRPPGPHAGGAHGGLENRARPAPPKAPGGRPHEVRPAAGRPGGTWPRGCAEPTSPRSSPPRTGRRGAHERPQSVLTGAPAARRRGGATRGPADRPPETAAPPQPPAPAGPAPAGAAPRRGPTPRWRGRSAAGEGDSEQGRPVTGPPVLAVDGRAQATQPERPQPRRRVGTKEGVAWEQAWRQGSGHGRPGRAVAPSRDHSARGGALAGRPVPPATPKGLSPMGGAAGPQATRPPPPSRQQKRIYCGCDGSEQVARAAACAVAA